MKKITPLIISTFFFLQIGLAQQLTYSSSQLILDGNSVACNTRDNEGNVIYVNENTFYRHFNLNDFGITSSYDITSIDYGIEKLENAPSGGFPVTVSIYSINGNFPTGGLVLITEVTENLQDQTLTLRNVPISTNIPANSQFVVAVSIPTDDPNEGGNGEVRFQIGSNKGGVNGDGDIDGDGDVDGVDALIDQELFSYLKANDCNLFIPTTFAAQGRQDVKIVMNVNGNGSTASTGDLNLVDFSYYPNPVKDHLNISAQEEITSVSIYNILGQEILRKNSSGLNDAISLASLASGTYMVKAQVNDRVGTFKVVKE